VSALSTGFSVTPAKQDKKKRGGISAFFESNDAHQGVTIPPGGDPGCNPPLIVTSACKYFPPSLQTIVNFPTDLKFDPGTIPDCNISSLRGKTTAGARAACPKSIVGQGLSTIHTLAESPGALQGTVTAFNGVPAGGNPTLYLHTDIAGVATKPILEGTITGSTLTVAIPPVAGTVIQHFDTTINKVVSKKKKNKKTGKVTKTYYFSARCSKGTWTEDEITTYQGGKTLTASAGQKCKQKKSKKKK
jgi:hypothetical protein